MSPRHLLLIGCSLALAACGGEGGGSAGPLGTPGPTPSPSPSPTPTVAITVTPATGSITTSATQQMTCAVTGSTNTACSWTVQEAAGGSVSAAGLYTAPAAAGTYHVVATAAADASKTAVATMTVTGIQTASTPWVTGYYAGWWWDYLYGPEYVDMKAMTHFVFGRLSPGCGSIDHADPQCKPGTLVYAAGSARDPGLAPDGKSSVEDYLLKKAHDNGTKTLLMIGGDGPDGEGFVKSTTDALRPTFVKNILDYLVAHDYDGVDIDWENELDVAENQRRLKALVGDIRAEAGKRARYSGANKPILITFPGYAISMNEYNDRGRKIEQWRLDVAAMVDQYNLMSYGIGTAFVADGWESWFSSPIYGQNGTRPYDLDSSIQAYIDNGVPAAKLGIGMGFYGIYYGPKIQGPRQSVTGERIFEFQDQSLNYYELNRKGYLSAGTEKWDDVAKTSYRVYSPGYVPTNDKNANPAGYLSYETPRSIAAKAQYVRDKKIGGTIIWAINFGHLKDTTKTNPLMDAVKKEFLQR